MKLVNEMPTTATDPLHRLLPGTLLALRTLILDPTSMETTLLIHTTTTHTVPPILSPTTLNRLIFPLRPTAAALAPPVQDTERKAKFKSHSLGETRRVR